MAWRVTNRTTSTYRLGDKVLPASGTLDVDALTPAIDSLVRKGIVSTTLLPFADGVVAQPLPFAGFKNPVGTALAAAAAAGVFGNSITLGTSQFLVGEAAQGNTKTSVALIEFVLPPSYVAGANITVTVNCHHTGTGTAGTKTIDLRAFKNASAGTQGSDICATAVQTISGTAADYAFTVTGTGLAVGDKLTLEITNVLQETGASASLTGRVNSVRVS
jgi:hypothetical protein